MRFSNLASAIGLLLLVAFAGLSVPVAAGDRSERDDARREEWRRQMQRIWNEPPTEAELKEMAEFMQAHSPHRWEAFNRLADDHPEKENLRKLVLMRFRGVQFLKEREPRLYETRLEQVKLEDEAWDLSERYRASEDEAERSRLRDEVRGKVEAVVDLWMSEREIRIDQLDSEVREAKQRLEQDRAQMAERIDSKVERYLKTDQTMGMDWRHHHWGKDKEKPTTRPSGQEGKEPPPEKTKKED